jgi:hypothetical protein
MKLSFFNDPLKPSYNLDCYGRHNSDDKKIASRKPSPLTQCRGSIPSFSRNSLLPSNAFYCWIELLKLPICFEVTEERPRTSKLLYITSFLLIVVGIRAELHRDVRIAILQQAVKILNVSCRQRRRKSRIYWPLSV